MPHGVYERPRLVETFDGKYVDLDAECREEQAECEAKQRKHGLWAGAEEIESYYYDTVNLIFPGDDPEDGYENENPRKGHRY